jgi:hypothetical protein
MYTKYVCLAVWYVKGYRRTACRTIHYMWPGKLLDCSRKLFENSILSLWFAHDLLLALFYGFRWWIVECVGTQTLCYGLHLLSSQMKVIMSVSPSKSIMVMMKPSHPGTFFYSNFLPWNCLSLILWWCVYLHDKSEGARAALSLGGTMLGYYPVRVLPSKTAIVPVNPTFLPRVRWASFSFLIWGFVSPDTVANIVHTWCNLYCHGLVFGKKAVT